MKRARNLRTTVARQADEIARLRTQLRAAQDDARWVSDVASGWRADALILQSTLLERSGQRLALMPCGSVVMSPESRVAS